MTVPPLRGGGVKPVTVSVSAFEPALAGVLALVEMIGGGEGRAGLPVTDAARCTAGDEVARGTVWARVPLRLVLGLEGGVAATARWVP